MSDSVARTDRAPARHAGAETVEAHQRHGVVAVLPVPGSPEAQIRLSPAEHRISLLVVGGADSDEGAPDLAGLSGVAALAGVNALANIDYSLEPSGDRLWHCLDIHHTDNLTEAYAVLCTIADHVQLGGMPLAHAVRSCLSGLQDLLAGHTGLTSERQIGLFGELCVVHALVGAIGADAAVASWSGPQDEEHDLVLPTIDLEVKTTTTEARHHWIGSATQLRANPDRPLHLLSLQITPAGAGPGSHLPGLVERLRRLVGPARDHFDTALAGSGYADRHADLYRRRWTFRTLPTFYLVDDTFPAMTPDRLIHALPQPRRVLELRYRLDLEGLTAADPPFTVSLPADQTHPGESPATFPRSPHPTKSATL